MNAQANRSEAAATKIARGEAIGADELRRLMAERVRNERDTG
jgi:hypothetical protein